MARNSLKRFIQRKRITVAIIFAGLSIFHSAWILAGGQLMFGKITNYLSFKPPISYQGP